MTLQVSWIRHRDVHLLTVGSYTYTNDQRFRPIHNSHTEDWMLEIKYPQLRDTGSYECQISTTPHMSHIVHLDVIREFSKSNEQCTQGFLFYYFTKCRYVLYIHVYIHSFDITHNRIKIRYQRYIYFSFNSNLMTGSMTAIFTRYYLLHVHNFFLF